MPEVYERMPFGAYRGERREGVPLGYLGWCLDSIDRLRPSLRRALSAAVNRRQEGRPAGTARPWCSAPHPRPAPRAGQ